MSEFLLYELNSHTVVIGSPFETREAAEARAANLRANQAPTESEPCRYVVVEVPE